MCHENLHLRDISWLPLSGQPHRHNHEDDRCQEDPALADKDSTDFPRGGQRNGSERLDLKVIAGYNRHVSSPQYVNGFRKTFVEGRYGRTIDILLLGT